MHGAKNFNEIFLIQSNHILLKFNFDFSFQHNLTDLVNEKIMADKSKSLKERIKKKSKQKSRSKSKSRSRSRSRSDSKQRLELKELKQKGILYFLKKESDELLKQDQYELNLF